MKLESGMRDLQRLAAHQPGLRGGGRDALAQHGAAQRADPVDQVEAEAARALHRQEIGEQRAVEQVDREACGSSRRRGAACRSAPAGRARRRRRHRGAPTPRARRCVAASRRPRLRPCAPIGGMRWAASPTSAMRLCPKRPHGLDRERKHAAARLDRDLAEDRMRALLDLVVERRVVERGDPLGLGGLDHADEARPLAGQRHQRERAALGVEFGRGVVVRPRVREIEGQRGLRIGAAVALDAGRGAAERAPSVGADDEAGGDAVAAFERDGRAGVVRSRPRGLRPRSA